MQQSMTGFGKASNEYRDKNIQIEIKSLNSKQLDLNMKLPNLYKEKEIELRSILTTQLQRGRIDVFVRYETTGAEKNNLLNQTLIKNYFNQLQTIANDLNEPITANELFSSILRLPDILSTEIAELPQDEWNVVLTTFNQALEQVIAFRKQEGIAMINDIAKRIESIMLLSSEVDKFDSLRIETIKQRILQSLDNWEKSTNGDSVRSIDKNRFEQELIYYLEKLDVTEEKVRLASHCRYFLDTMNEPQANGKKLNFISQEIGREINTLGSKASHTEIQQLVVLMKDELEKIKEQLLNLL